MKKPIQILLLILIFQDLLTEKISLFTYVDEILAVCLPIYCCILIMRKKAKFTLKILEKYALGFFLIFVVITIVSSIFNKSLILNISGLSMIMTIKGYVIYFSSRIIFNYHDVDIYIFKKLVKILEIAIYIFLALAIINIPFNIFQRYGIRFGIESAALGFSHPTELSFFVIFSFLVILFYVGWEDKKTNLNYLTIAVCVVVLVAGRSKSIGFIALYVGFMLISRFLRKVKLTYFIPLIPIALIIGAPRIKSELFSAKGARGVLYSTAVKIANDFFPLGSGFGSFGSEMSRRYYSSIYDEYQISNVWGLSRTKPNFITDTYWAMIIGESGWIGFTLIFAVLALIFVQISKMKGKYMCKMAVLGMIVYTGMCSIAEPIYSSNKSAAIFILISLLFTISEKAYNKNVDNIDFDKERVKTVEQKENVMFIIQTLSNGGAERVMSYLTQGFPNTINKYLVVYHSSDSSYNYDGKLINLDVKPSKHVIVKISNYFRRIIKTRKLKKELNINKSISLLDSPNLVNILSKKNEKVIISVRNHKSKEMGQMSKMIYRYFTSYVYNKADYVVAISEGVKNDLISNYAIDETKVKVIYNPINIEYINGIKDEEIDDKYKNIFNDPVVITTGRLAHQKGQWHLIRSFSKVVEIIPTAKLVILGKGELYEYLDGLIKELNLTENVFLFGFTQNPFKYIAKSKLFVLSSLFEGFGNVIIEAMACGTTVLSTDCKSGPREIIAPESDIDSICTKMDMERYGVLIPNLIGTHYNANEKLDSNEIILSESIISLLSDADLLEEYGKRSYERVKDFELKSITEKWIEL